MITIRKKIPTVVYFAIVALVGSLFTLYISSRVENLLDVQMSAYTAEYGALEANPSGSLDI